MRRVIVLLGVVVGLSGCDDVEDLGPVGPSHTIHVEPLFLPDFDAAFRFDVSVRNAAGALVSEQRDLSSREFGNGLSATYVLTCDPSVAGPSRVDLAVHTLRPGSRASRRLPPGLVPPATSVGVACVENRDALLSQVIPVASVVARGDATQVAFMDTRCSVTQACGADGNRIEVSCARAEGGRVALGLRDARLVCGEAALPVAPLGTSATPLGETTTRGRVEAGGVTWTAEATPTDRSGCALEASLVAAPDLGAGQAPACHAWPVMQVSLPLDAPACGATPSVEVDYAEAGGPRLDRVIASRRAAPAAAAPPSACLAPPTFQATSAEPGQSNQGFVDLMIDVILPTPE